MKELEVLAPAGDEKSFFCAINNGANAIYLGLKNFNARNKAQNFDLENLSYYVNIAHLHNVKIYLVVNTLITDKEISDLLNFVKGAIEAKVDAFIVQDLGIAKLLIKTFKGIILHASTQMGIHSLQGAIIAEKIGFKRIVLSREVTKQDIINIKNNTNLEIEYFVQGALCVSFSGNCYLSSIASEESGNRGRCLQPCRLLYSSFCDDKRIKKGYLLSANDLCLIDKIKELKECGVCSLKIEGRLRRPSYVSYTTKTYSEVCKAVEFGGSFNSILKVNNFKKLFNRGEYNTGFYLDTEPNKAIINTTFQNHRGIKIGSVIKVNPFKEIYEVLIKTSNYEIKKGDGLKFIYNNTEESLGVGSVKCIKEKNEYIVYTKINPKVTSEVYLTVDSKWEDSLLNNQNKIKFNAEFLANENDKAILKLSACSINIVCYSSDNLQKAQNQKLKQEDVLLSLQKTKDTFFELNNLNCKIDNVFMPKALLNELRRNALEKLEQEIINNYQNKNLNLIDIDYSYYQKLCDKIEGFKKDKKPSLRKDNITTNYKETKKFICFNEETLFSEIEKYFNEDTYFVFSPDLFTLKNVDSMFDKLQEKFNIKKLYLDLPKVLRNDDFNLIEKIILSLGKDKIGVIANNIGHLYFSLLGFEVVGGVYLNITNNSTIELLKDFNINTFVKSFESFASALQNGLTYIGYPAVMTFCHCPYKTNFDNVSCRECKFNNKLILKNDSGKSYKVRRTKIHNCIFELLNNSKINLDCNLESGFYLDLRK